MANNSQVSVLAAPVRRHPDCAESDCDVCLHDHNHLGLYIGLKCGGSLLTDWLGEYRKWLDKQGIPAEVNGWASRQAFDGKNVSAFCVWYAARAALSDETI